MKKLSRNVIIIIILLLLLLAGGAYHFNTINKKDDKYEAEVKLREALQDTMRTHKNEKGEWEHNKRTLQGEIGDLTDKNVKLNADQKELISRVKSSEKKANIFSAALIRAEVRIDSLNNLVATASEVDTVKNTVTFQSQPNDTTFKYSLKAFNVRPVDFSVKPTLEFNLISFPNKQFITFQWDKNERKDFPVSFSVSNSNPYYKVHNIESYAIPGLQKEIVKPTGWQKVWKFVKINGKYVLVGAVGFGIGALATQ